MVKEKRNTKVEHIQPVKLPSNVLPTKKNVICAIIFEKMENHKTFADAINIVVNDVILLWKKLSLPIINVESVRKLIKAYYQNYSKAVYNDSNHYSYMRKLKEFKVLYNKYYLL